MVERVLTTSEDEQKTNPFRLSPYRLSGMPETLGDFQLLPRNRPRWNGVVYEALQRSLKRHVALKVSARLPPVPKSN